MLYIYFKYKYIELMTLVYLLSIPLLSVMLLEAAISNYILRQLERHSN